MANTVRSGDIRSESSRDDTATPDSPYLEFFNQSFSTNQDLSLPDRVIASPVLQDSTMSSRNVPQTSSPRDRILNKLKKRGSKETFKSGGSSTSSPLTPAAVATSAGGARASSTSSKHTNSDGSSSTLSSPALLKSILKQSSSSINSNSNRTPTTMNSPLPEVLSSTRSIAGSYDQRSKQQQYSPSSLSSQPYQPVPTAHLTSTPIMTSSSQAPPVSAPFSVPIHYPQPPPPISQNNYIKPPPPQQQQQYPPPPSQPSNNVFSVAGLVRPASPFAMRPASPGSFDNGGRDTNTNSLSSTHRLSKNSSHGTDPTYNITQTDMTLDALAQRWQAYQAMMKKSYLEDPFYKRWTKSKWLLLFSNTLLLIYSCAVLAVSIGYMSHRFDYATVMMEFHSNLILLAFAGSVFGITCAILGFLGVFRENRTLLTIYTTLLWVVFALYVSVGYIAFRRYKNHLNQHLRDEWMHSYSRDQRLLVQRQMKCCGWLSASSNGEYDLRCFPMINLPGCQFKYREYERALLSTSWTVAFSIVPFQLFVMIVALLCSNHVDGMLRSGRPGLKSFKEEKQE